MAIVLADNSVISNVVFSQTSIALTFGSTPADNSIIFLYYGSKGNAGVFATLTWPSGFTELVNQTVSGGGVDNQVAVAWKRAASESSATYTLSIGGSGDSIQALSGLVWTGVDTTTAFDVTGSGQTGSFATSIAVNSITTSTANAVHVIFCDAMTGDQGSFTATGYTQAALCSSSNKRSWSGYKLIAAAGATGSVTVNGTAADQFVAYSLALKPASGGAASIPNKIYQTNFAVKRAAHY